MFLYSPSILLVETQNEEEFTINYSWKSHKVDVETIN